MLNLQFSNRYELLAGRLVEALGGARASIFGAETVIVPSAALRRDLSLRIASRHGVCAQVDFDFLGQWLWRQIGRRVPQVAADSPFAPPVLAWRIDRLLATLAAHPDTAGPRLGAYLRAADPVMRFGLAGRVAALFAQYITYRSDWLATWAAGARIPWPSGNSTAPGPADEAWQSALWRQLLAELGIDGAHPAQRFLEALASDADAGSDAPGGSSVHLFCLPAVPPLYLEVLRQLGRYRDLRLYLLNPCREYWFDLVSPRRLSQLAARGRDQHVETGNPLLAGWGRQAQSQIGLLLDADDSLQLDAAAYVEAPGGQLLASLQNAVLDGVALPAGSLPLAGDDRSIEVHVCHSLTRELEVLHDHLLGLFAAPRARGIVPAGEAGSGAVAPALQPQDILVVLPDLEAAAPLIDAVFGTAPPERYIPFAVTGRPRRSVNRCAQALQALLALLASRCPASAVFELLHQPPVARRFGLDATALDRVQGWIGESGFRWGLGPASAPAANPQDGAAGDAATAPDAVPVDAVPAHRHSLADGLQRLFLAHALPPALDQAFAGQLPAGTVEGSEALALGAFWRFNTELRRWQQAFARAQSPAGWLQLLLETVDSLLLPVPDEFDELRELQTCLRKLTQQMHDGGVLDPVEPAVLRAALDALLDEPARGGVATGRVSFAAISSLRSLPFRVVCAIGLDDGAFPSLARPLEFDLMAQLPRSGDRQRGDDDRNSFLDLLLSAREQLYLSHTGRSVRDNTALPPSVLLSELLDLLLPAIATDPADPLALAAARNRLVVEHPLQAFSPSAFSRSGDPRLQSYQQEYAAALQAARDAAQQRRAALPATDTADPVLAPRESAGADARPAVVAAIAPDDLPGDEGDGENDPGSESALPFFSAALPPAGAAWRSPDIDTLLRFFRQPCRSLLQSRLGLSLPRAEDQLEDDEAFSPDFSSRNALERGVLPAALRGAAGAQLRALADAVAGLPDGALGMAWRNDELERLTDFASRVRAGTRAAPLPLLACRWDFDIDGERWQLDASFADLRPQGLVRHRYDDARVGDHLQAWLWHLALCAAAPAGVEPLTTWHARDGSFRLRRCAQPVEQLGALLRLYRSGLQAPLHFFPKSAWAYMQKHPGGAALGAALGRWQLSRRNPHAESADPAYRLALRGVAQPIDAAFESCAQAVLGPLLAHLEADTPGSPGNGGGAA